MLCIYSYGKRRVQGEAGALRPEPVLLGVQVARLRLRPHDRAQRHAPVPGAGERRPGGQGHRPDLDRQGQVGLDGLRCTF